MVILYAIIGAVTTISAILLRYYLAERKKTPRNDKFCYNCNLNYPNKYNVCPKCGLKFGS
jgi:predicted amidophosphoribosyltransferase